MAQNRAELPDLGQRSNDEILQLLENGEIRPYDRVHYRGDTWTPLVNLFALRADYQAVAKVLAMGADPTAVDSSRCSSVYAAVKGGNIRIVEKLLQLGASANLADGGAGLTPLCIAACAGRSDIVKLLLDHGAISDVVTRGPGIRKWPLVYAVESGDKATVLTLLERKCSTKLKFGLSNLSIMSFLTADISPDIRQVVLEAVNAQKHMGIAGAP